MQNLNALIVEFKSLEIEVSTKDENSAAYEKYNKCTYKDHLESLCVVFPKMVADIQSILKAVTLQKQQGLDIAVYPISSGQNWGYGSATPTSSNCILMSLQYFNNSPTWVGNKYDQQEPYGKQLGIVRIEAGVSQQQFYDFLQSEGGHFWMDATGSSPSCSVLANCLERGFGHTAYGDHFEHVAGMELVLADGSVVKTGHAGCDNAANIGVHKHGLGPVLEGLASQSNLFIVTAIYLHLMPAKKKLWKFFIKIGSNQSFYDTVERLRPLKLSGLLDSQMHCANTHKGIQAVMRYPFKETNNTFPIPESLVEKLVSENQISPWTISGAIYGDSFLEMFYKSRQLKKALKGSSVKLLLLPKNFALSLKKIFDLTLIKKLTPTLQKKMSTQFSVLSELIGLKQGKPTEYFINSVYHRKREIANKAGNPDVDSVGLIWIAPLGPATKETLELLVKHSTEISEKYNFDPAISITLLNKRAVDCVLSIVFDRTDPEEDQNAVACYKELLDKFNSLGFTSYRSANLAMLNDGLNYSEQLEYVHNLLKLGLDKENILSPGHYLKPTKSEL